MRGPIALVVGLVIAACTPFAATVAPGQRVEITGGASVLAPAGSWRLERKQVTLGESVRLAKEHMPFTRAEDVHTIVAILETHRALGVPDHEQAFRHFSARQERDSVGGRQSTVEYSAVRESSGADCLRYTLRATDRGVPEYAGRLFEQHERGRLCFHPTRPLFVWVAWSERFLEGQGSSATQAAEVDRFLGSVLFLGGPQPTLAPPVGVAAGVEVFSDEFDRPTGWTTGDSDGAFIRQLPGLYEVVLKASGHLRLLAPTAISSSARITLGVTVAPGLGSQYSSWYGVVCTARLGGEIAIYYLILNNYGEYKIAKGVVKAPVQASGDHARPVVVLADAFRGWAAAATPARTQEIQADCLRSGATMTLVLRVDGATLLTAQDIDRSLVGLDRPGLYVEAPGRSTFTFTSFEVRELR